MTSPVLSKTLTAGTVIEAADLMTLYNDLLAALQNITTAQISLDAGITSKQLADRYSLGNSWISLIPFSQTADLTSPANYTLDDEVTIFRTRVLSENGREMFLSQLHIYIARVTASSPFPVLSLYKNGVIVGGAGITLDVDDTFYRVGHADPIAGALASLADGDLLEFKLDVSAAGTAEIGGLWVRLAMKSEVVA